jgi:hypothetical protein
VSIVIALSATAAATRPAAVECIAAWRAAPVDVDGPGRRGLVVLPAGALPSLAVK